MSAGADPGFFSGRGALVSCSTSTPINHIVFFLQNTSCIRKPQVISEGMGGGGAHPLHPPTRSAPGLYVYVYSIPEPSVFMPTQQTVLFYLNRNSTSMEQMACVPAHVSYFLCCTRKSNAAFTLGANVRYSLGTNVNTLFFQAYPR